MNGLLMLLVVVELGRSYQLTSYNFPCSNGYWMATIMPLLAYWDEVWRCQALRLRLGIRRCVYDVSTSGISIECQVGKETAYVTGASPVKSCPFCHAIGHDSWIRCSRSCSLLRWNCFSWRISREHLDLLRYIPDLEANHIDIDLLDWTRPWCGLVLGNESFIMNAVATI